MVNTMNKLRKYFSFLLVLILVFSFSNIALANDIESIDIKAEIQDDASVIITDHRIFNATRGTEHYLSFGNLGESRLLDFKVFENGKELQDVGNWDVNKSISEKAGKYGVNKTSNGFELCFGIGSLGRKDFTIQYKLSNFVRKLDDGKQAIYWQFIQPGMDPISRVNISVTNAKGFSYQFPDTKIWGFGYDGSTEITENALLMDSGDHFTTSDYMVLLSIFPENTFKTSARYPYTEESIKDKAMDGARPNENPKENNPPSYNNGGSSSKPSSNSDDYKSRTPLTFLLLMGVRMVSFLGFGIIFSVIIFSLIAKVLGKDKSKNFKTYTKKGTYYRDIPYDGEVIEVGKLITANARDYISSLILKWISEGRLKDEKEITGLIFKKERLALVINDELEMNTSSQAERDLWDMVIQASGEDGILSEKEFTKYMSKHLSKFNSWVDDIIDESTDSLTENGYLNAENKRFLFTKYIKYTISNDGQELLDRIRAFENYLKDFSLVTERQAGDAKLWDDYMIWAAILGISEEVYKQLKIVDPQMVQSMDYSYQTIILTNAFANNVYNTYSSLNSPSYSSSGGGGGSSFSGGGGGASGGSFGGGTR